MQPRELVIEGLTSFTERISLDFTDVSLFALVGPTGAGKSSIVDAMTLALYGRIPRLHANEIAPAISTTSTECTVGLTFTVRGKPHRAVRSIRRTKTGASTLEAALERLDDNGDVITVLAGAADDVTVEVERLIGLTFNEFTKAVVLPQGEFARVLQAQPSERQSLLSRLLGVGIYDRVKQRAGAHARSAQERAEQTGHQIAQLGRVSAEQVADLEGRVAGLDALIARLKDDAEQLGVIRDRFRDATEAVNAGRERANRLQAIGPPPEAVREFADAVVLADAEAGKARSALEAAEAKVSAAEASLPTSASLEALTRAIALHQRTDEHVTAVSTVTQALADHHAERAQITIALDRAREEEAAASTAQRAAHREHAALQAVDGLSPGDDCPVCASALTDDAPAFSADSDAQEALAAASTRATAATQALGKLDAQLTRSARDIETASTAVARAEQALTAHTASLAGLPTLAAAQEQLAAAREGERQMAGLRREAKDAKGDLERTTRARAALEEQAAALSATLDRLRLSVADQDPPPVSSDVVADWVALHGWAEQRLPQAQQAVADQEATVASVTTEGSELRARMEQACGEAGVPHDSSDPRDRAVQHRADLAAERDRMATVLSMVEGLQAEEADARVQATVGSELARLLRTDQFQRWLLDEATRALVAGASVQLRALSSGRYELGLDGRGAIHVRDLANAGAPRSVRTLSGGETFLASLALALSLAEQIAMSATGPVALESLFIDEGFGALDPETLDIAAGAIEQLGAGDRTVGVITHVAEMAERLPTRFVVERTAGGSRVRRVDL